MNKLKSITNFSKEDYNNLTNYVNFLLNYNKKINLISKSTENEIWERHIIDSIQLLKYIKNYNLKYADIGTGAGLPGIPLSIFGIKHIELFEKSYRKCEFLNLAKQYSENEIIIRNENLNNIKDNTFDVILSRALANINILLEYSVKLSKNNTELYFLKGKKIYEEINIAKKYWLFDYELFNSITSTDGKIIKITNFKKLH